LGSKDYKKNFNYLKWMGCLQLYNTLLNSPPDALKSSEYYLAAKLYLLNKKMWFPSYGRPVSPYLQDTAAEAFY